MHLTLNLGALYKTDLLSFSYEIMFDRIICVLVRIYVKGHFVMSIIQFMHLIRMNLWIYLYHFDYFTTVYVLFPTLLILGPISQSIYTCNQQAGPVVPHSHRKQVQETLLEIFNRLTTLAPNNLWDVKNPTHCSKGVGDVLPGVMVYFCL